MLLLDAARQGLNPDYTIADAGQGLRVGQKAGRGDTPCHGDVFHVKHQYEGLADTLSRLANGAASRRKKLHDRIDRAGQRDPDEALVTITAFPSNDSYHATVSTICQPARTGRPFPFAQCDPKNGGP
jgi:hypothetical protein